MLTADAIEKSMQVMMKDPQKFEHIFDAKKHKFGPLLELLGGKINTMREVLRGLGGKIHSNGFFENIEVLVSDQVVTTRGVVIDGIVRMGTMFIKR